MSLFCNMKAGLCHNGVHSHGANDDFVIPESQISFERGHMIDLFQFIV